MSAASASANAPSPTEQQHAASTSANSPPAQPEEKAESSDLTAAADAAPKVIIDSTKDLWQNILLNVKDSNVEQTEVNFLIVGEAGCGKTSLLQRVYAASSGGGAGHGGNRKPKPTTALDYSFARRTDRDSSQVAHLWELAQGMDLAQLSEVVITPENVHAVVVAVAVDASAEGLSRAWMTVTRWLARVDRRVSEIRQKMTAKGSSTPAKMLTRAQRAVGIDHPDLPRMRLSGVPTVVVVNKMDAFTGDTRELRTLVRSMRFVAHLYGAHLVFTSAAEPHKWRTLVNHLVFQTPLDSKSIQLDPERGGVFITADVDSFADIGEPELSHQGRVHEATGDTELDRWKGAFDDIFPPAKSTEEGQSMHEDAFLQKLYDNGEGGYGEPEIDAVRRHMNEELEQYRKQLKSKK